VLTMTRLVEESGTRAMNLVKAKETELHLVCDAPFPFVLLISHRLDSWQRHW